MTSNIIPAKISNTNTLSKINEYEKSRENINLYYLNLFAGIILLAVENKSYSITYKMYEKINMNNIIDEIKKLGYTITIEDKMEQSNSLPVNGIYTFQLIRTPYKLITISW